MGWGRLRPWLALIGPLLAVVVLTAAPAGLNAGELSWPKWLVAGLVAAGGVLVAVWTPLVTARTDSLAARITRAAERDAQGEDALNQLPRRKGKIPLVEEVTDRFVLDIHEAIPLPAGTITGQGLSPELPTYIARDVDADLRTALEARSKTGGFVLLVGPAASGKTRCAYEAIRAVLPRWRLIMPGDAATLTRLVTGGADLKHSVLWLNETQNFLTGPDRLKASTVRQLLADTAKPVILIGTIWPTVYEQLRTPASSVGGGESDGEDLNKDSRDVLGLARRFSLGSWSEQEWARAEELTSHDPRIEQAVRHRGQAGLTQLLSAAPELLHRWEQAKTPYAQAVITAAVVARRCGHPNTIPTPIMEALAQEYLTGPQRAAAGDGWFVDALTWACDPVHNGGGIAPLQACGDRIGQIDGYQVSDILVDHTGPSDPAPQHQITQRVWAHLTDLAATQACSPIGLAAYYAGQPNHARTAWQRAADAGEASAMVNLGVLLMEQGDLDGARTWYTRAINAGETDAMRNLGIVLAQQGDLDGARTWYTRAIDAGDTGAMLNLGIVLAQQGDLDGARTSFTRAIDAGDTDAMRNLGIVLAQQGDLDGARTWYTRAIDAGDNSAMLNLGIVLAQQGDIDGARTWYTRAADAGDTGAMINLGHLFMDRGDLDGARTWFTRAAEAADTRAMVNLGVLLMEQGDLDGARSWYTRAIDAGDNSAMLNLGYLLGQQGDIDGARAWYTRAADAGDTSAMRNLGNLFKEQGDLDRARTWYTRAADAGDTGAMINLGNLLNEQGDIGGAWAWYNRAHEAGDTSAMIDLGKRFKERGELDGARAWYNRAAGGRDGGPGHSPGEAG